MTTPTTTTRVLLAAAPATRTADAEIAAAHRRRNDTDQVDGYGRTSRFWPTLSAAAQDELAASHQWCLTARQAVQTGAVRGTGRARVEAEIGRRSEHLDYLVGAVFRLVRKVVDEKLAKHSLPPSLRDELLTEAYTIAVLRAGTYDARLPGTFAGYIGDRLRSELGGIARRMRVSGYAPESWHRVSAIARGTETELVKTLGRAPTDAEFVAAVETGCEAWALERLTPDQQRLPLAEQRRLARKKLVKQGLARGVADIAEIRSVMGPETSLDIPVGDDTDGSVTRVDLLTDGAGADEFALAELDAARVLRVLQDALAELDPELAAKVVDRLDGGETDGRSVAAVALRTIRMRVAAPHTQWAALATTVEHQFVDLVDDPVLDALYV